MSPFKNNLQKLLIFSFTAISIIIVVLGITRTKKTGDVAGVAPDQTGAGTSATSAATQANTDTTGAITFSGAPYQTPWGNATAEIKVKNGHVVAVTMPQVPNSPPSIYAEPYLVQQALATGSANIQGVSGATYTSLAFKSSLESALAKAKNQGQTIVGGTNTGASSTAKPTIPRQYRGDDEGGEVEFRNWFK